MTLAFLPMPEDTARHIRAGGADHYGNPAERFISKGDGIPCRRCLEMVAEGDAYLLFAWRPFSARHAFAETGPVFIHERDCAPGEAVDALPEMLESPDYILRGYSPDERIVYGTGGVIPREAIPARAAELLADPRIAAVHVRSSRNNCFQCSIVPAGQGTAARDPGFEAPSPAASPFY